MSLILEGFMGSGKSAVGERLASKLGIPFIDTDREIEERQGCPVADIFSSSGEEAFRQMETSMLYGLYLSEGNAVISLGGGMPVRAANAEIIKKLGKVVYLKAEPEVLISRLEKEAEGRPMLDGYDLGRRVSSLLEERGKYYLGLADIIIDVSWDDIDRICERILEESGL